jgi:hypothetical protein
MPETNLLEDVERASWRQAGLIFHGCVRDVL